MTITIDNAAQIVGLLAGLVALFGALFAFLRYVIRAETAELRPNGGGSLKDAVNRIERDAKTRFDRLDRKTDSTNRRLARHIRLADEARLRGAETEDELRETISTLAGAIRPAVEAIPGGGDHQ